MAPSLWQILIVVGLVLLFFGPGRLPGLGKSLGEAIRGFKKGISEDDAIDVTESDKKAGNEKIDAGSAEQKDYSKETSKSKS